MTLVKGSIRENIVLFLLIRLMLYICSDLFYLLEEFVFFQEIRSFRENICILIIFVCKFLINKKCFMEMVFVWLLVDVFLNVE